MVAWILEQQLRCTAWMRWCRRPEGAGAGLEVDYGQVPRGDARIITASVDTSIGGQPEKAQQLVLNRETGRVDSVSGSPITLPG